MEQILSKLLLRLRVVRQKSGELLAQRAKVGALEERQTGTVHWQCPFVRCDSNHARPKLAGLGVATQDTVVTASFEEKLRITRIQLNGAVEVSDRFCPAALTTIDQPGYPVYVGIVWELAPGEFEFGTGA